MCHDIVQIVLCTNVFLAAKQHLCLFPYHTVTIMQLEKVNSSLGGSSKLGIKLLKQLLKFLALIVTSESLKHIIIIYFMKCLFI